jgi:hypothetical protein
MRANKLVFNHVLLISERNQWRRGVDRLHNGATAPLEKGFLELFRRAAVARMRLALQPDGLAQLLHLDTNGKDAQAAAWKARKRVLRRFASSRKRKLESEEVAAPFLEGMETPPLTPDGGARPYW